MKTTTKKRIRKSLPVKKKAQAVKQASKKNPLSEKETQVFHHFSDGLTSRDIGKKLKISYRTAETHIGKIYKKLKLNNQYELMHYCHKSNLLSRKNAGKITDTGKSFLNKLNESELKLLKIALKDAGTEYLANRLKLTNKTIEFYIRRLCIYSKTKNRVGLLRFIIVNNVDKHL